MAGTHHPKSACVRTLVLAGAIGCLVAFSVVLRCMRAILNWSDRKWFQCSASYQRCVLEVDSSSHYNVEERETAANAQYQC
jgi:hypothetical protein